MATFSFDIVSEYDKAEMNNVFAQVEKEIGGRYDFKGSPAGIEWLGDKKGFKLIGANTWQVEAILDIVRKKNAARNQSSKVLDLSKEVVEQNLKATWEIPFIAGLDQDKAKHITKLLRDEAPKVKAQIQGEAVRVTSGSKDELQGVMRLLDGADLAFPLQYTNYR
jgi:uncharacterized protein YajQ (UPF0234 family)